MKNKDTSENPLQKRMHKLELRKTMWAEQKPDVYYGSNCDQHHSQWFGGTQSDKGSEESIGNCLRLTAETFPPGTKIVISEPVCPNCNEVPTKISNKNKWVCECDFDWEHWATQIFA